MHRSSDSTFLITGAGSGIGRATALAAAATGGNVMIAGTTLSALEETAHLIGDDRRVVVRRLDVSDREDVNDAVEEVVKQFGRIDCALNNAGVHGPIVPIEDYPPDDFLRVLAVNVAGTMWCMKAEISQMLPFGSGSIVNVASASTEKVLAGCSGYMASKSAVLAMTKVAAREYSARGLRINAVSPGLTSTGMTSVLTPEQIVATEASIPIGRMAVANEIAAGIMWLFSDEARYVVGSDVFVDGGFSMS